MGGKRMWSDTNGAGSGPALVLNDDDLLLLEALVLFHARASTSSQVRARLADLEEQLRRVRIAASAAQTVRGRVADVDGGTAGGSRGAGARAEGS
jgi:hypothetical protein